MVLGILYLLTILCEDRALIRYKYKYFFKIKFLFSRIERRKRLQTFHASYFMLHKEIMLKERNEKECDEIKSQ